jgi:hypothetical protein
MLPSLPPPYLLHLLSPSHPPHAPYCHPALPTDPLISLMSTYSYDQNVTHPDHCLLPSLLSPYYLQLRMVMGGGGGRGRVRPEAKKVLWEGREGKFADS